MDGFAEVTALMRCGIYMLCYRRVVVYVGKSTKPFARLATHLNLLAKQRRGYTVTAIGGVKVVQFDQVYFRGCMLGELDSLEQRLIREHEPKHNVQHKPKLTLAAAGFDLAALITAKPVERSELRRV